LQPPLVKCLPTPTVYLQTIATVPQLFAPAALSLILNQEGICARLELAT